MSFAILKTLHQLFPSQAKLVGEFESLFRKKLWHELTLSILEFLFSADVKGKVSFAFYTEFVDRFKHNIDPIKLLKILKETVFTLPSGEVKAFLDTMEQNSSFSQEVKVTLTTFRGIIICDQSPSECPALIAKTSAYLEANNCVEPFLFSSHFWLCMKYYRLKNKHKDFYLSALQYLTYTPAEEIAPSEKIVLLQQMAVSCLISEDIYNFSELLEQPMLQILKGTNFAYLYDLLQVFNRGSIQDFTRISLAHVIIALTQNELNLHSSQLHLKIKIMAFLSMAFNLPKNERTITLAKISQVSSVEVEHVQMLVMKMMALKLIRGTIDQLAGTISIEWVAPKLLTLDKIEVMLNKFEDWKCGVEGIHSTVTEKFRPLSLA